MVVVVVVVVVVVGGGGGGLGITNIGVLPKNGGLDSLQT